MADTSATATIVSAAPLTRTEILTLAGGIGGGIGANIAINSGAAVGAVAITAYGAGAVGVVATGIAAVEIGTLIGNIPFVRDNLQSAVEYFFPTDPPPETSETIFHETVYGNAAETITEIGCFPILLPLGG